MSGPESPKEVRLDGSPPPGRDSAQASIGKNPFNRFVVLFLLYLGVIVYLFPKFRFGFPDFIEGASKITAGIVYWMLRPFATDLFRLDAFVALGSFRISVIDECTGVYEMIIYAASVFAYPARLRDKGIGLLLGLPLLYGMNVLRILMLLLVGSRYPASFEFMHIYFWQATLVLMVSGVWLLWIFTIVQNGATRTSNHP